MKELVESIPHGRMGLLHDITTNSNNNNNNHEKSWQYEQCLNIWRREYLDFTMDDWSFNWPTIPTIREDIINEKLFISLLVMLIIAQDDLKECFQWERK